MLCCFCVGTTLDRQRRIHLWLAAHCACSAAAEAATVNACAYVIALLVWRVLRERCAAGQAEAVEEDVLSAQREEERQQHAVAVLAVCPPSPVGLRFLVHSGMFVAPQVLTRGRLSLSLSVYVALTYIPVGGLLTGFAIFLMRAPSISTSRQEISCVDHMVDHQFITQKVLTGLHWRTRVLDSRAGRHFPT